MTGLLLWLAGSAWALYDEMFEREVAAADA